jgi:hypothetical protein
MLAFNTRYAANSLPGSLKVEGISTGEATLTATIITQDDDTAKDQLKIKVIPLNLVAVDPAPSSDKHEICHKDKLIICVNNNDSDGDDVNDLIDFFIPGGDPDLAKITLQKPSNAVDSDISGDITVTFPANINAFKNQDKTGGAAPTTYSLSDLPKDIYLEGATASSDILNSAVKVEMTLDSGVKCHDEIRYTVVHLEILKPKGSKDANPNPTDSFLKTGPYRFDFQWVKTETPGYYSNPIEGNIEPSAVVTDLTDIDYFWSVSDGEFDPHDPDEPQKVTGTATPTYKATEVASSITLTLDPDVCGAKTRQLETFQDHLARDYANFETGGSCKAGWKVTTFNVNPQPVMSKWNCHGSTWHHWNGSGNGLSSTLPPVGDPKKTVVVTHKPGGGGTHPPLGALNRGDIVAYYQANGPLMHSQTCTGNGTETYGANNETLPYPGAPSDQSWKWATSTAGDWANDLWLPGTGIMPVTIKVYNKP